MLKSKLIIAALLTAGSLITTMPANAMPSLTSDAIASTSQVEQAGWRCGRGWHVDRFGRCVPAYRPMMHHRHWRRY